MSIHATDHKLTERIPGLRFEPWIGTDWPDLKVRLFFIGESHYGAVGEFKRTSTIEIVDSYGITGRYRFFSGIASVASGYPSDWVDRKRVWRRIAFCNLSQDVMTADRQTPPVEAQARFVEALREIIASIKPTQLIALGNFVWGTLEHYGALKVEAHGDPHSFGNIDGIPVMYSYHPSGFGRFNPDSTSEALGQRLLASGVTEEELQPLTECHLAPPMASLSRAFSQRS